MKKLILLIIFSVNGFSQNYEIENMRAVGTILEHTILPIMDAKVLLPQLNEV